MSTAAIPRPLLPILATVAIPSMGVAASTNVEALLEFGHALYGSTLAWTLPAAVIGYEIVSSVVFFLAPKSLPVLRKSAAVGALLGFAATVFLAILWALIEDGVLPGGLWLKIVMKPVPSLVAAAFLHMLVIVWQARTAAAESAEETAAEPIPSPVSAPEPLPVPPAAAPAPEPPAAATKPSVATPRPRRPRRPRPAAPAATPAVQTQLPTAAEDSAPEPAAAPVLPRVAEDHVLLAVEVLKEVAANGGNPDTLKSGQALRYFKGCSDRTVRAALQVARVRMAQELVAV